MKTITVIGLALLAGTGGAFAQIQIDKSRPASKHGEVSIENSFGAVKVIGWDKDEVAVTGHVASGADGIDFSGDKDGTYIEVDVPESWLYDSDDDTAYRTSLEIHVPRGSELGIETLNASITVTDVNGSIDLRTINGNITYSGSPPEIDVESVTGNVDVTATEAVVEAQTVSGTLAVRGAAKSLEAHTLSGSIQVSGRDLERVRIETTAGNVGFQGSLRKEGQMEVETFSGNVVLTFPPDVAARFKMTTFGGDITSSLGPPPRRNGKFNPYQELRFATGLNEYDVSVETYNGTIDVKVSPEAGAKPK